MPDSEFKIMIIKMLTGLEKEWRTSIYIKYIYIGILVDCNFNMSQNELLPS